MRAVLRRILVKRGFEVAEASDRCQALAALERLGTADLALVDWNLPEMDGPELVTHLRQSPVHDTMVIMIVATEPKMREVQNALVAGVSDYLTKPFNSMQVDEKLSLAGLIPRS
jgi:two-component system chemotaxis response regulator CheY